MWRRTCHGAARWNQSEYRDNHTTYKENFSSNKGLTSLQTVWVQQQLWPNPSGTNANYYPHKNTHTHTHTWLHKPCITTFNTSSAFHKNVWSTASLMFSWDYMRWFMKRSRTVLIRPDQHFSNVSSSYNCKLWPTTLHFKHDSETVKTNQVPNIHQRSLRSKVIVQSHN